MCTILVILLILFLVMLRYKQPPRPWQTEANHKDDIVQASLEEVIWVENANDEKATVD